MITHLNGSPGSGKSTIAKFVTAILKHEGYDAKHIEMDNYGHWVDGYSGRHGRFVFDMPKVMAACNRDINIVSGHIWNMEDMLAADCTFEIERPIAARKAALIARGYEPWRVEWYLGTENRPVRGSIVIMNANLDYSIQVVHDTILTYYLE